MTTDGGIVAVGYEDANSDWITLRKFSPSGTVLWSRTFQRFRDNTAFDVIETNDGGLAFVGNVYGETPNGSFDFYFVKTDCEGKLNWNEQVVKITHE